MRKPPGRDGGRTGDDGNVYHGPWPERAPEASEGAEQRHAASTNWMRDADAITGGFVEPHTRRPSDEFFDELCPNPATGAADDDLDAFITRAATAEVATAAPSMVPDGSAALPSDVDLAKPARRLRVDSRRSRGWRSRLAMPRARRLGGLRRSVAIAPKRVAAAVMLAGVIAAFGVIGSSALWGTAERVTLAGTQATDGGASRLLSSVFGALARMTASRRSSAHHALQHVYRHVRQPRRSATHRGGSRLASPAAQPVAYVEHTVPRTPTTAPASPSSSVSSAPAASSASATAPASAGPTGPGAPFEPGQQVK